MTSPIPADPAVPAQGRGAGGTVLGTALRQARIELRNQFAGGSGASYVVLPLIAVGVMFLLRDTELMGSAVTGAQHFLPGMLGAGIVLGGFVGVASELMVERDDGTLLRMKAVPRGLQVYVLGKAFYTVALNLLASLIVLIPTSLLFPGTGPRTASGWLGLLAYAILGLLATVPAGTLVGAFIKGLNGLAVPTLAVYALMAISGVFWPITALPGWLQAVGQVFPLYWVGLGMRSAMLPPAAAALEIGGSWRPLETLLVLGAWAVAALVMAPLALRRMVRGVSGSRVAEARERMLSRGY